MKSLPSRAASWFPAIFAITGSLVMAVGILLTSALPVSPSSVELPLHGAVYVGVDTCYTCHTDEFDGWSAPLAPQVMADTVPNPKMVVADVESHEDVRQIDVDEFADVCASEDTVTPTINPNRRQYIVQTDIGQSVLPQTWNAKEYEVSLSDSRATALADCNFYGANWKRHGVQSVARTAIATLRQHHVGTNSWSSLRHQISNGRET